MLCFFFKSWIHGYSINEWDESPIITITIWYIITCKKGYINVAYRNVDIFIRFRIYIYNILSYSMYISLHICFGNPWNRSPFTNLRDPSFPKSMAKNFSKTGWLRNHRSMWNFGSFGWGSCVPLIMALNMIHSCHSWLGIARRIAEIDLSLVRRSVVQVRQVPLFHSSQAATTEKKQRLRVKKQQEDKKALRCDRGLMSE